MMEKALEKEKKKGSVLLIRRPEELQDIDALIIPGGESTTISKALVQSGFFERISQRIQQQDIALMGTCAGCVLLASSIENDTRDVRLLQAMDMTVQRNAFGRQKHSFEQEIQIEGFDSPFPAVFIRGPVITNVGKTVQVLANCNKKIVAARQEQCLALSFHPELTSDCRFHQFFLDMI